MATVTGLLAGAKGKYNGSVFQKGQNGTILRINRTPKNPKTEAQATQRAAFAPVAKFYSPLSVCLEKSFEGKSKAESYQAFLKANILRAKQNGWLMPKGSGITPFPYQVSKGTIQPVAYEFGSDSIVLSNTTQADLGHEIEGISTIGDLSKIFKELGYLEGDQVTFIFIKSNAGDDFSECWVTYDRFNIAEESNVDFEPAGAQIVTSNEDGVSFETKGAHIIGGAIIISRFENSQWRRSTQFVVCSQEVMDSIETFVHQETSRQSYMPSAGGATGSNVYLDGNDGLITVQTIQGLSFQPTSMDYPDGKAARVAGLLGGSNRIQYVSVKLGADYLLTDTTKGAIPAGDTVLPNVVDGTTSAMSEWLMSQGVAASLF